MDGNAVTLTALGNFPLVCEGDDLAEFIIGALQQLKLKPLNDDVLVLAQKIVSKSEGRFVRLSDIRPSAAAIELAEKVNKDARLVEVILSESTKVVAQKKDVLIVRHRNGYVMANAGIDQSNVGPSDEQFVLLLPENADASAARLKAVLDDHFGVGLGIIINDSFGRPWRMGTVGVAIGCAGFHSLRNMVGDPDLFGRELKVTEVALADELAAAASLLMGQGNEGRPVVHARGLNLSAGPQPASRLIRPTETDMFR